MYVMVWFECISTLLATRVVHLSPLLALFYMALTQSGWAFLGCWRAEYNRDFLKSECIIHVNSVFLLATTILSLYFWDFSIDVNIMLLSHGVQIVVENLMALF